MREGKGAGELRNKKGGNEGAEKEGKIKSIKVSKGEN